MAHSHSTSTTTAVAPGVDGSQVHNRPRRVSLSFAPFFSSNRLDQDPSSPNVQINATILPNASSSVHKRGYLAHPVRSEEVHLEASDEDDEYYDSAQKGAPRRSSVNPNLPVRRPKMRTQKRFRAVLVFVAIGVAVTLAFFAGQSPRVVSHVNKLQHNVGAIPAWLTGKTIHGVYVPPLAHKSVLLIKTGHSVVFDRIPAHLEGPRPDIPNRHIYSEVDLEWGGYPIINILTNLSTAFYDRDDFSAYHMIQMAIRDKLSPEKLQNYDHWRLDKYKFMPMHGHAYRTHPNAEWFIAMDGDTFLFWSSLMRWLSQFNPDEPRFFGTKHGNGQGMWWPHGGSGYVLSRGMMSKSIAKDPWGWENSWDDVVAAEPGGDVVISEVFRRTPGLENVWYPEEVSAGLFSGDPARDLAYTPQNYHDPLFTLHHLKGSEVHALRKFEQRLLAELPQNDYIRRCDVLDAFTPNFLSEGLHRSLSGTARIGQIRRMGWKAVEAQAVLFGQVWADYLGLEYNANFCNHMCEERPECFSWSFENNSDPALRRCVVSQGAFGVGSPDYRFESGWRIERITAALADRPCRDPEVRKRTDYMPQPGSSATTAAKPYGLAIEHRVKNATGDVEHSHGRYDLDRDEEHHPTARAE